MDFPHLLSELLTNHSWSRLWQGTGRAFGHLWKIARYVFLPMNPVIISIQTMIGNYLFKSHSQEETQGLNGRASSIEGENYWKHEVGDGFVVLVKGKSDSQKPSLIEEMQRAQEILEQKIQEVLLDIGDIEELEDSPLEELDMVQDSRKKEESLQAFSEALDVAIDLCKVDQKSLTTWKEFLDFTDQLKEEFEILKLHRSQVEEFEELDQLVKTIMQEYDRRIHEGEKDLCAQVKKQHLINNQIELDGHCLFSSIDAQLEAQKEPKYYRKLAADFMRAHPDEFRGHIKDILNFPKVNAVIKDYAEAQGGLSAWGESLEKNLGRKPNMVDYYCECLEKEELKLWGGYPEILALSYQLQVSILIFTHCGYGKNWRFDVNMQQSKDQPIILLFYNGVNHYQDLKPKLSTRLH